MICRNTMHRTPAAASEQRLRRRRVRRQFGFTLIELMVVISIILILISVAVPIYSQSIARAREAVLRQNLFAMRTSIDQYSIDKEKAPQSLDDLVQAAEFPSKRSAEALPAWAAPYKPGGALSEAQSCAVSEAAA